MKRELEKAMKHLCNGVPGNCHVSIDLSIDRHKGKIYPPNFKVYVANHENIGGFFTGSHLDPMTAVLDALVKISQQLETEATDDRQTD